MNWRDLLANWGLKDLKINTGFLEATWEPQDEDRRAAWEMTVYI